MGLLRTYLAISVVLSHTTPLWGYFGLPPNVAVRVFFMISGFYMALICSQKYTGKNSTKAFYIGRFLRIYPLAYLALLLSIVGTLCYATPLHNEHTASLSSIETFLLYLPNITLLGSDIPFLFIHDISTGWHLSFGLPLQEYPNAERLSGFVLNSPSWTLGNELLFYLIVPYVSKYSNYMLAVITTLSFALQMYIEHFVAPWSSYFFFPSNLVFFLTGMFSFRFYDSKSFVSLKSSIPRAWVVSGVIGLLLLLIFRQYISGYRNYGWTAYFVTGVLMPWLFDVTKNSPTDRLLGEFSYPVYILHAPFVFFLSLFNYATGYIALPAMLFISYLTIVIIEKPLERYRQQTIKWILSKNSSIVSSEATD